MRNGAGLLLAITSALAIISPSRAETLVEYCDAAREIARTIMDQRLHPKEMMTNMFAAAKMSEVIDNSTEGIRAEHKSLAQHILGLAYFEPFRDGEQDKQIAISLFEVQIGIDCLRSNLQ
ncbi:hypothetical protein EOB36_03485 [Mesorhizobium sp. M6A.T.Cr.TU.017.01.1.1]|uniref:hypothetical protein n=1 Tax=unclassified Mesorhizobium TaxID=325217 RepID=UPI000FCBC1C4|nr:MULTISPECIES: hypothetical protein [unclassified Mesorhizobium]RUU27757.1 hypothetical protein EOC94_21295 [Mesorhizobium sp. M6A.T.Ce.TU.016.01.1.1]RUV04326.1 hypothetical protein EOB36_03485 [Mesorhizobium sp. M6A.T.Cr.TU.017.01.1.1]RWP48212.1 MAG: hypothetical protein EOR05_15035 [Mesorhizobium sp.]